MGDSKSKLLFALYVTNFLSSLAFGTVIYLLPVYAEGLGASFYSLGVIGGVGNAVYTISTLVTGFFLDIFDRTRFYFVSCVLGAFSIIFFSQTLSIREIIIARSLLGGISAAFWVTTSTLIADTSPKEVLTTSMARYNISWIAAFAVGPVIGGLVSSIFGFHFLFIALTVLNIACVVIIAGYIRPNIERREGRDNLRVSFQILLDMFYVYATLVPYALILGIFMAILPGYMRELSIPTAMVGLLITTSNGFRGLGFLFSERFVLWGTRRSLFLASILMSGSLFLVVFSTGVNSFLLPMVLFGFAGGIITPVILDIVADNSGSEVLGKALGTHEAIYGFGMCIGPIAGGFLAEMFQPRGLYFILAILALLMLPLSRVIQNKGLK